MEDSKAKIEEARALLNDLMGEKKTVEEVIESHILKVIKDCVNSKRLLIIMVDTLRQFIKAERTGNWELHLQTVREICFLILLQQGTTSMSSLSACISKQWQIYPINIQTFTKAFYQVYT